MNIKETKIIDVESETVAEVKDPVQEVTLNEINKSVTQITTLDFENIPQNAVVLVKLNVTDHQRASIMQRAIAEKVLGPRIEKLKEKRVCILFMEAEDNISIMTEAEMNSAGWFKKDQSKIITLS